MESTWVSCPYCGQAIEILVDVGGGGQQAYVEDCEVCCRPWQVLVRFDADGLPEVEVSRLDD